jgi:hypothetical protein
MTFEIKKQVRVSLIGDNKNSKAWSLGHWTQTNAEVWGLLYYDFPTHMCYSLDRFPPQEAIARLDAMTPPKDKWVFEVGNDLAVKKDDLIQGFKELGIWDRE